MAILNRTLWVGIFTLTTIQIAVGVPSFEFQLAAINILVALGWNVTNYSSKSGYSIANYIGSADWRELVMNASAKQQSASRAILLIGVSALVGCRQSAPKLVGHWVGRMMVPVVVKYPDKIFLNPSKNNPDDFRYDGYTTLITNLQLDKYHHFLMEPPGCSGKWTLIGDTLTLTPSIFAVSLLPYTGSSESSTNGNPDITLKYIAEENLIRLYHGSKYDKVKFKMDFKRQ